MHYLFLLQTGQIPEEEEQVVQETRKVKEEKPVVELKFEVGMCLCVIVAVHHVTIVKVDMCSV